MSPRVKPVFIGIYEAVGDLPPATGVTDRAIAWVTTGGSGGTFYQVQEDDWVDIGTISGAAVTLPTESFVIAASAETGSLTASSTTAVVTFRFPYDFTITGTQAALRTAPAGASVDVDIHAGGTSIFTGGSLLSVAAGSTLATAAPTSSTLSTLEQIEIFIDAVGSSTTGEGLKVTILGGQ